MIIKTILITLIICLKTNVMAKNLNAHVHGVVNLDVAYEKNELLIMLQSPSESFLGFEYKPKTNDELKKLNSIKNTWNTKVLSLLGKDVLKDCKISKSTLEQKFSGENHSTIFAESYINCKKPLAGRNLEVRLKESYNKIQSVKLQLIRNDGTVVSEEYSKKLFNVKL